MARKAKAGSTVLQKLMQVPPPGEDRRSWIKYQLSRHDNASTGRRWSLTDVANEAGASQGTVSLVYLGERTVGPKIQKIMRITARVLEMKTLELFGIVLDSGDGYVGEAHE